MTTIAQIVGIRKSLKPNADNAFSTLLRQFVGKRDPFLGLERRYTPKYEDGDQLQPESSIVQLTVLGLLKDLRSMAAREIDIQASLDYANTEARADVVLRGAVLIPQAPTSYMLFLEKKLAMFEQIVRNAPRLDSSREWSPDSWNTFKTDPVETTRVVKVPQANVVVPATDKFPAQVMSYNEDRVVGTWKRTDKSGAIPEALARQMLDRILELKEALIRAREEANARPVQDFAFGDVIWQHIFEQ